MTESSSDAVTASEARIIKQIEYYFSDFNLLRKKFLSKKIQEDDGWVTMDTMLTFNRLKEITDDAQRIVAALKKSSSGLMEVSEQGDKIRRRPSKPLPANTIERREEINARTVFAKTFPLDVKLKDLLEFFEGYGQVDNVFMKKHLQKKTFKGCVFVTFTNMEDAAKFVNEEETKFKEHALEDKCFKTNYLKREEVSARTVFAKPFPLDVKLKDLQEFFESYGQLDKVFMKRHILNKTFKGSVFVTFDNKEDATKFVNEEGTKFKEHALEDKCFKTHYFKREEFNARTVFAKPFPLDVKLEDLHEFFESYGQLDRVFMKRHFQNKTFNGSVFVTFDNHEEAAKFVNEEETKFKGQALKVKRFKTKCRKHKAAQKKTKGKKDTKGKPHKKGEDETKEEATEPDLEKRVGPMMAKYSVLHLKGLKSKTSREQVKAFFSTVLQSNDAWVDFDTGATKDYIRLRKSDSKGSTLENIKTANDGKVVIHDSEIEVRTLEGKEELQYWKKAIKNVEGKKNSDGEESGGEEQNTEEPPAKVTKSEKVFPRPEDSSKKNKNDASSDGEEQDIEEPPYKVIKSEMIIKRSQGKSKQNKNHDSIDGEEQDTVEPPARNITRSQCKRKQNKKNASSDGDEQDIEEPPYKVIKSEMIIKRSQGNSKQNKNHDSIDREEQDTEEPPARNIPRSQCKRKQNKKNASSDGDEKDIEEPPAKVIKSKIIIKSDEFKTLAHA
ncbi:hypothetical protein BsWGS_00877 [Bradybaena similaris]